MSATTTLPAGHAGADETVAVNVPKAHIVHPAYGCLWTWRVALYGILVAAAVLGGPLVQLMAIVGGVFALLMDWDGLFRHVFRWVALIGSILITPSLAPTVATQMPANWVGAGLFGIPVEAWITFSGLFVVASIVIGLVFRQIRKRPWLNALNHFGGSALGAAEGAMAVVVLYWGLSTFSDTLHTLEEVWGRDSGSKVAASSPVDPALAGVLSHLPGGLSDGGPLGISQLSRLHAHLASDPVAARLNEHNVFEEIPAVKAASELTAIAADPEAVTAIARSPSLSNFAQRPDVQARMRVLTSDPKIKAAINARDFNVMIRSGALRQIVGDAELLRIAQQALPELKQGLQRTGQARLASEAEKLTPERLADLQRSAVHVIAAAEAGNKAVAETMMQEHNVDRAELEKMKDSLKPTARKVEAALKESQQ